ncbi:GntR family transcriptional regulator [Corynebacterium sp. H128]|uniref:GntR family transcriptional regulator n=1 Tax=unclassified Corynebacterium TaxID=2624378 RepID=UPI0030A8D8EB
MDESTAPLFRQIADLIEDAIVEGSLAVGERAPSTNELAEFHRINPATARKGLTLLVDAGVLEKRRGIGMFVTSTARSVIVARRREAFPAAYLAPLIDEAVKLDMSRADLHELIDRVAESRGLYEEQR